MIGQLAKTVINFKRLQCFAVVIFLCGSLGFGVFAISPEQKISSYIYEVWRTENGLPQNKVRTIVQTQNGYIWLATEEGLARYDGSRFTVFDKQNTEAIKSNSIQALTESRDGSLWIGTESGLIRWLNGKFTAYTPADGLSSDNIEAIYEDKDNNLWVGTVGGLNRFADGRITAYTTKDGLPDNSVSSIFQDQAGSLWVSTAAGLCQFDGSAFRSYTLTDRLPDSRISAISQSRDGRLWFGTSNGLAQFKDGHFRVYTTSDGLSNNKIWSIHEDSKGDLWIGTDGGLNRYRNNKFTAYTTREGLSDNTVWTIHEDKSGSLWLGTPGGLTRVQGERISTYTAKEGLSNNVILSILEDREGNLWVGTEAGGLNVFKDRKFFTFTSQNGLPNDMAWTTLAGRDGSIWIGTQGGLSQLKNGKLTNYTTANGLTDNIVRALCEDREGGLWIGTPGGLMRFRNGQFTTYKVEDGLSNNAVWAIHESGNGDLWIGTLGGLTRLRQGKFTVYSTKDGLPDDSILALQSDPKGGLWIGTRNGGLSLFKDGQFRTYNLENGLSDMSVRALYKDSNGDLWIGTRRGGLNRLRDGKITAITTKDGLFDDGILQILEDGSQNLWMSCTKGIFRVGLSELNDFAEGRSRRVQCISYGTADGMQSRECNGGQPAGCKGTDGKLWFPTVKGVASVDPQKLTVNQIAPPVVIEQVIADGVPLELGQSVDLSAGVGRIEFHYAGLSFAAPEKVKYKYLLEGYDKNWIEAGSRRAAYYTSIPPGQYRFRVLACNNDGVWSEAGDSFNFYLKPHFYQTWLFYVLLGVGCAGLGLALYRLRIRQVQSQFTAVLAERNRLASEIHDTLAQGFVGIALQVQAARKILKASPQTAEQHLDIAEKMVNHSVAEARRAIWNLRSAALENGNLAAALLDAANQLTAGTGVEVQVGVQGTPRPLQSRVENTLLRIGQEALTNAMKHAKPRKIAVELCYDAHSVRLRIADDGEGFDTNTVATASDWHFGLTGMRERLERLRGELDLQSGNGKGTQVVATIPT